MKLPLLLVCVFALAASGRAQSVQPPGQAAKTDSTSVANLTDNRKSMDDAKTLAQGNNLAAAEQTLTALNRTKPNTAAWHMETAQRLMQTAEQLAREAHPANVAALVASALSHLDQADALTKDARVRAAAKTLAGFIHERYRADPAAALASYQAAVQLAPDSKNAAEAADRMQKTVAKTNAAPVPGTK